MYFLWLKENNHLYKDIMFDDEAFDKFLTETPELNHSETTEDYVQLEQVDDDTIKEIDSETQFEYYQEENIVDGEEMELHRNQQCL